MFFNEKYSLKFVMFYSNMKSKRLKASERPKLRLPNASRRQSVFEQPVLERRHLQRSRHRLVLHVSVGRDRQRLPTDYDRCVSI